MQYYDHDPATGTNVLLADTKPTHTKTVSNGATANYALANQNLSLNYSLAAGHLLHAAVDISVMPGNAGGFGELLYNGASGTTSYADLPQNHPVGPVWPMKPGPMLPSIISFSLQREPVALVHCSGMPGATYLVPATTSLGETTFWKIIITNVARTNGLFTFTDTDSTYYNCRFYRASTP